MSEMKKITHISLTIELKEYWVDAFNILKDKERVLRNESLGEEELYYTLFCFLDLNSYFFDDVAFRTYLETGMLPEPNIMTYVYQNIMDNSGEWVSDGKLTTYDNDKHVFQCNGSFVNAELGIVKGYIQHFCNVFASEVRGCHIWCEGEALRNVVVKVEG